MSDHPWVPVPWGKLLPNDVVQDPAGREWWIGAVVDMPGQPLAVLLCRTADDGTQTSVWSDRERDQAVQGWRFLEAPGRDIDTVMAIGQLRLAGFDVKEIDNA